MKIATHLATLNLFREPDGTVEITVMEGRGAISERLTASEPGASPITYVERLIVEAAKRMEKRIKGDAVKQSLQTPAELLEAIKSLIPHVTPGPYMVYGEPDVGLRPGLFAGKPMDDGFSPMEPLQGYDLTLVVMLLNSIPILSAALELAVKIQNAQPVAWLCKHPDHPDEIETGQYGITSADANAGWTAIPLINGEELIPYHKVQICRRS